MSRTLKVIIKDSKIVYYTLQLDASFDGVGDLENYVGAHFEIIKLFIVYVIEGDIEH